MKYELEECFRRLNSEVGSIKAKMLEGGGGAHGAGGAGGSVLKQVAPGAEKMTAEETSEWLKQNKVDQKIIAYLGPCDGEVLQQLVEMKHTNPQFYDQSLGKIENINMMAIANFNAKLEKLFGN